MKIEGLVFHGIAGAIRSRNSFLYGRNENIPNIHRQFADNSQKNVFHEISAKSCSQGFLLIFKFSGNCPKTHREFPEKIIAHEFNQKHFPEFYNFPGFSESFETILVNVRFPAR